MKPDNIPGVDEALAMLLDKINPIDRSVTIPIEEADDRALSQDVCAPIPYPHYPQAIMDGYAVRATDIPRSLDASDRPVLRIGDSVSAGFCKLIHTGDALPEGADSILPLEDASESEGCISVLKGVLPGQWIWHVGAGIQKDALIFRKGMQLKPTDIVILAKLGIASVSVYDKPRVLVLPTGNELVKSGDDLKPGIVYESNGLMCALLIKRYGGIPALHGIVPDNISELRNALQQGQSYDLVVTIGGSSASKRDLMDEAASGTGRIVFHGVALSPGNHMGAGEINFSDQRTPLLFLPGYSESCAVAAFVFVCAAIRKLGHYPELVYSQQKAVLDRNVNTSAAARAVRKIRLADGKAFPVALIADSAQAGAYAYLVVPEGVSEISSGSEVVCTFFE